MCRGDRLERRPLKPLPLLDSPDDWIAYGTASELVDHSETKDRAMPGLTLLLPSVDASASRPEKPFWDDLGSRTHIVRQRRRLLASILWGQ